MTDPLAERARRRLFGEPVVNQPRAKVVRRIQLGEAQADADGQNWPQSAADVSPLAAALVAATKRGKQ